MSSPRHLLLRLATLMLALAAIFAPQNASAKSHQNPETRVRDFSAALSNTTLAKPDLTPDSLYEKLGALRQLAPGPPLVPKGGAELDGSAIDVNLGGFFRGLPGRKTNCVNCSISTDSTLAGRPASAMPSTRAIPRSVTESIFGRTFSAPKPLTSIISELQTAGPGARAIISGVRGPGQAGHSFNAVVNSRGAVKFIDGQVGGYANMSGYTGFRILRTN